MRVLHDFGRAYNFTKDVVSFPFMVFFIIKTIIKVCLILIFIYIIHKIYIIGKDVYDAFLKLEGYIKEYIEKIIQFLKKYIDDLINDVKNIINKIKSLF